MLTLVINLEDAKSRLRNVTDRLDAQGLGYERMAAVDGRGKPPGFDPRYAPVRSRLWFGTPLTGAEVACFASHVAALERFLRTSEPVCLVLEDDVAPVPGAGAVLASVIGWLERHPGLGWDCLHLGGKPARSGYVTELMRPVGPEEGPDVGPEVEAETALCLAHDFPLNASALLWSRAGAARFLRRARRFDGTVDNVLRSSLARNGRGLCLTPRLFSTVEPESQIDTGKTGGLKSFWFAHRSRSRATWRRRAALLHRRRWHRRLAAGLV